MADTAGAAVLLSDIQNRAEDFVRTGEGDARTFILLLEKHAELARQCRLNGGDGVGISDRARHAMENLLVDRLVPGIHSAFSSSDPYFPVLGKTAPAVPGLTLIEGTEILKAVTDWERAYGFRSGVGQTVQPVRDGIMQASAARVAQFKKGLGDGNFPDFRSVSMDLLRLESLEWALESMDRKDDALDIRKNGYHLVKMAMISGTETITRFREEGDLFSHFDVAGMLASVEDLINIMMRLMEYLGDDVVEARHHFVESFGEQVFGDFSAALSGLGDRYLTMVEDALLDEDNKTAFFINSTIRVSGQIAQIGAVLRNMPTCRELTRRSVSIQNRLRIAAGKIDGVADASDILKERGAEIEKALAEI